MAFLMPDSMLQVYMKLVLVVDGWDVEGLPEQEHHSRGHTVMVSYPWMAGGDRYVLGTFSTGQELTLELLMLMAVNYEETGD